MIDLQFTCDMMFVRLGRWLRAAGYDTVIIQDSISDLEIYKQAMQENRFIITSDHHFLQFESKDKIILIKSNNVEKSVVELSQHLPIDWLYKPFSRCLVCNCPLEEISQSSMTQTQIPTHALETCQNFWICNQCEKVYWDGSHTSRMLKQLECWNLLIL